MFNFVHHKRSLTHRSKASDSAHCDRFLAMEFFLRKTGRFYIYQAVSETSTAFPATNPKIKTSSEQGEMSNVRKSAPRCNRSLAACYIEPFVGRARYNRASRTLHDDALGKRHLSRASRGNHGRDISAYALSALKSQAPSLAAIVAAGKEIDLSPDGAAIARHALELYIPRLRKRSVAQYIWLIRQGLA